MEMLYQLSYNGMKCEGRSPLSGFEPETSPVATGVLYATG